MRLWRCAVLACWAVALLAGTIAAVTVAVADRAPALAAEPAVMARLASTSLLLAAASPVDPVKPDRHPMIAVGERGHVLLSRDGGATWRQSPAPVRATLTAVRFADARRGVVVGHDETILRTADGGETWTLSHYAPERQQPLLDVWLAASGEGIAVGAYAAMYRTSDFGVTWAPLPFAPQPVASSVASKGSATAADAATDDEGMSQPHLNAITADGHGRLYVAAEAGHLYRSDDRGGHWIPLPSPYAGSLFGLLSVGDDALLAFGLRGHVLRSDDAGQHWAEVASGTQALLAGGARLDDGSVVIVGSAGVVLVSRDGGHRFVVHQEADRRAFSAAVATGAALVVVGEMGSRRLSLATLGAGEAP